MDDGRKVITIAHPEQSSGELKIVTCILIFASQYIYIIYSYSCYE